MWSSPGINKDGVDATQRHRRLEGHGGPVVGAAPACGASRPWLCSDARRTNCCTAQKVEHGSAQSTLAPAATPALDGVVDVPPAVVIFVQPLTGRPGGVGDVVASGSKALVNDVGPVAVHHLQGRRSKDCSSRRTPARINSSASQQRTSPGLRPYDGVGARIVAAAQVDAPEVLLAWGMAAAVARL